MSGPAGSHVPRHRPCRPPTASPHPQLPRLTVNAARRVVELETQRLEDSREDREEFLIRLREELERQAAQKHVKLSLPDAARRPPA